MVFLAACGGGGSANDNVTNSNNTTEENDANTGEQQNNEAGEEKNADTSDLPRFITDPRGYYTFNDMIPFISTYEFIKHDATFRLEWLGEEEVDGEMAHKFHYLSDDPDHPEEYKEFHAWLDEGGFGVAATSANGEELPTQVAHGFVAETLREMYQFGFYFRDQIIDGDYELVSIDTNDDTLLDHDVEIHNVEVYNEEDDERFNFTIAEGDNFEVILSEEVSGSYDSYYDIDILELTLR